MHNVSHLYIDIILLVKILVLAGSGRRFAGTMNNRKKWNQPYKASKYAYLI
jgi:hypothetical protein